LCELFALSSRLPATVSLSLKTLAEHGGGSAPHADGWGIAYYREDGK
jgi:glutamine amidotransferase